MKPPFHSAEVFALSTDGLAPHDRVEYWREMVCRRFAEVQIASRLGKDFSGRMQAHQYQAVRLTSVSAKAQSVSRIARHAATEQEDCYFAVILLSGCEFLAQDGREARLYPGDMAVYDAARPHTLIFPEDFSKLILQIPREELDKRVGGLQRATAVAISGGAGPGAIASGFLRSLAGYAVQATEPQRAMLAAQALDLLSMGLASAAPVGLSLPRSRPLSLARVKSVIERHLGNPDLDSAMVARGAGLSSRYVNQLFEEEGTSLMRYVWRRRLECCRDDILSAGGQPSLYGIALRWGFNDASHFSRAFRNQFGIGPRDFMRRHEGNP